MQKKLKELIYCRYNISFSKSGEDLQLKKLINEKTPGVYVDIGCWHPIKASNTYFFSLRKWKGICVDPNPEMKELYKKIRPNDIFINKGIGMNQEKNHFYFMLDKKYSSMNTFEESFILKHNLTDKVKKKLEIKTTRLDSLLSKYINEDDRLDFFDIDVEGMDLDVLKSNNWEKYRPKIIMIESDFCIQRDMNSDLTKYLKKQNYTLYGKSLIQKQLGNLIFIDNNNI